MMIFLIEILMINYFLLRIPAGIFVGCWRSLRSEHLNRGGIDLVRWSKAGSEWGSWLVQASLINIGTQLATTERRRYASRLLPEPFHPVLVSFALLVISFAAADCNILHFIYVHYLGILHVYLIRNIFNFTVWKFGIKFTFMFVKM